jgi:hypothetical protein
MTIAVKDRRWSLRDHGGVLDAALQRHAEVVAVLLNRVALARDVEFWAQGYEPRAFGATGVTGLLAQLLQSLEGLALGHVRKG